MSQKYDTIQGLRREIMEVQALYEISRCLNSSDPMEKRLHKVLDTLHDKMGMARGTLALLSSDKSTLTVEVAHGLDEQAKRRGSYKVGEGITGKVVQAGEPIVVPNIDKEPLFLNKTRAREHLDRSKISFLCVPIKLDQDTIGALSVDRLFHEDVSFQEDIRLLSIISSMIAQTVQIYLRREKEKSELQDENLRLKRELAKKFRPDNIIGESKRIHDVLTSIEMVSQSKATVLIRGETGTGKELVSHAIHYASDRREGPFVKVSCAALPDTLLEAELFGHEKGSFTGALASKQGRFEISHKGTLFLDEIGDIALSTQIKLLRVLQEKEFERVGGTKTIKVDIRLITATNRDLEKLVREGKFREDLYYRLNVVPIFLPALRERREDIPLLVNHFLGLANKENGKKVKYVSDAAMQYLMAYAWPGNIRELQNAVERAVVLCKGDTIEPQLFPIPGNKNHPVLTQFQPVENEPAQHFSGGENFEISAGADLPSVVQKLEEKMIQEALKKTCGNQRRAAKTLGLTERILGYKIKNYNISPKSSE